MSILYDHFIRYDHLILYAQLFVLVKTSDKFQKMDDYELSTKGVKRKLDDDDNDDNGFEVYDWAVWEDAEASSKVSTGVVLPVLHPDPVSSCLNSRLSVLNEGGEAQV
jgi:hypothetical protein